MSSERLPFDEKSLREKLTNDPTHWETRRQLAHGLYDQQVYDEAADIVWNADPIPSTDLDLAFAIRILAKAHPRRAIRLLTAVLELNQGKAVQNMAMANALLHHGMVLQAARFYGAALEADNTLVNPDIEHFMLWSDDESTMWGLFEKHRPKLGQLPWMLRDPKEALKLTSRVSLHTTPISVPDLPTVAGEELKHDLYQQEAKKNAKITPPPAVTIPIDRVDPKHRLYDVDYGATVVGNATPPAEVTAPAEAAPPIPRVISEDEEESAPSSAPTPPTPIPVPATKPRFILPSGPAPTKPPTPPTATPPKSSPAAPSTPAAPTAPAPTAPAPTGSPTRRLLIPGRPAKPGE